MTTKKKNPSQEYSHIKGTKRGRLISERKKRQLTQGELAAELGVSLSYISSIENGRNKPGFELSIRLEEFFQVPYEDLIPDL
ncbi:helix-turn-helix transcriptional regulator [Halobacillus seohaensis]|uniref:Helix-turn-helix transcriptional regulator n=1 Tax=Halobacillus seohaensis TaxID=447421 RepID=A0ABW2EKE8_9BACI